MGLAIRRSTGVGEVDGDEIIVHRLDKISGSRLSRRHPWQGRRGCGRKGALTPGRAGKGGTGRERKERDGNE